MNRLKYKSVSAATTGDFRDRGSKFLAFSYPVSVTADTKNLLQALRREHPKANHHCYAFRIGSDLNNFRAVDDGEPSGSAGRPILNTIDSYGITNVLIVVVRYFGGTLLGVPGLINAYKTASDEALKQAEFIERWVEDYHEIAFDYPVMSQVLRLLHAAEATIMEQELQLFCRIVAGIPVAHNAVLAQLSELRGVTLKPLSEL